MPNQVNAERQEISVSLRDLLGFVLRGALPALLVGALAATGTYVLTQRQAPVFQADATVLVVRSAAGTNQFGLSAVTAPPIDLGAYQVAMEGDRVLTDALQLMGVTEPSDADVRRLRGAVGSSIDSGVRDSSLLRVEARAEAPESAVVRANAVAAALVDWDRRRASESIERVIGTLEQQIEALSEQVRSLQALGDGASPEAQSQIDGLVRLRAEQQQQLGYARALVESAEGLLSVLQPAGSTVRQTAPRPVLSAAVAALLAVVAVYAVLLLRAAFNIRLRSTEDVAQVSGLPILAEFPTVGRNDTFRLREASSYLRTNLLFATDETQPRVFMVTSSAEGEGKTTVARQLAEGFVRYGYRTLLVDADLRSPSVAEGYEVLGNVPASVTTASWLSDPAAPHEVMAVNLDQEGQLDVIPQFEPIANAPELLGRGFRTALVLWEAYDIIVIDTPPVSAVADPLIVAPHCSGTVLVVNRKRSDRRKLAAAVNALQRVGVPVLGVVANDVGPGSGSTGYGAPYGGAAPRRQSERSASARVVPDANRSDPR